MKTLDLCSSASEHTNSPTPADRAYVEAHRFMFGPLGEHVATAALLVRDSVMRPGFALPVIRLAPVAPHGGARGLSGNSGSLAHVVLNHGIWLYLHRTYWEQGAALYDDLDEVVLHELLHNELRQFGESPEHKGAGWARRCQEISTMLGVEVRIERARTVRRGKSTTTGTPAGCLPYEKLVRWPADLLRGGPPLRQRLEALKRRNESGPCSSALEHSSFRLASDPAEVALRGEALP